MEKSTITPHLWFDKQAKEAAEFYVSVLSGDSAVKYTTVLHDTPSGDAETVSFRLRGQDFMAISAGPVFKINPSVSFFMNFDSSTNRQAREELDTIWSKLFDGGIPLMPLDEYPFSKRYGWIQDKYGLSWQLILSDPDGDPRPFITPSLLFTRGVCGRAEEAMKYYMSVFSESKEGIIARYPAGMEPDKEGTVMYADFLVNDIWMVVMDSAGPHEFNFNEAVSFMVSCKSQKEIDFFWEKLSAVPQAEACGWCKDKFGVSWQIVPENLTQMMSGTPEQVNRVTQAFLQMKKFDLAAMERAFEGS
jgi:predicted 3-demethylubiquinone-9 3-methyltransferase (glyoxalase superfamily)